MELTCITDVVHGILYVTHTQQLFLIYSYSKIRIFPEHFYIFSLQTIFRFLGHFLGMYLRGPPCLSLISDLDVFFLCRTFSLVYPGFFWSWKDRPQSWVESLAFLGGARGLPFVNPEFAYMWAVSPAVDGLLLNIFKYYCSSSALLSLATCSPDALLVS